MSSLSVSVQAEVENDLRLTVVTEQSSEFRVQWSDTVIVKKQNIQYKLYGQK